MAQRVQVLLEDDLSGGTADETVSYALDGQAYEIDLNSKNAEALRKALAKYLAASRKVKARPVRPAVMRRTTVPQQTRTHVGPDPKAVRAWAGSAGVTIPARGRIPAAVLAEFEAAHQG
jgi:ribosomal protein L16/L10AE